MELLALTNEIYAVSQRLSNAANEVYKLANKRALTERTYRMYQNRNVGILQQVRILFCILRIVL